MSGELSGHKVGVEVGKCGGDVTGARESTGADYTIGCSCPMVLNQIVLVCRSYKFGGPSISLHISVEVIVMDMLRNSFTMSSISLNAEYSVGNVLIKSRMDDYYTFDFESVSVIRACYFPDSIRAHGTFWK